MVVCASFCWWIPSEKKVKSFFLRVLLSTRQANVHMIAVNESLFECLAYNRQTTLYLTICDTNFVYLCIWQELIWDYSHRWSAITHSSLSGVKEIETDGGRKSWLSWHILSHYLCDSSVRLKCDNKYGFFKIELRFTTVLIFGQTHEQKLRNCPNSRYSSIVKFGRNCENLVNFYQFGLEGSEFITMMYGQTQNFSWIAIWGNFKCLQNGFF